MNQTKNARMIALMKHAVEHLAEHAQITLQDCQEILRVGEQENNAMYLGFAHYYSGEAYYTLNNVEKVLYHISQAIGYLEHAGAFELVARSYNLTGITSLAIGNAAFAMNYYMQALECCRNDGLEELEHTVSINIGMLYYSYGEYEKASNYLKKSLEYLQQHLQAENRVQCQIADYIGLGRCALHTGDVRLACEYEQKVRGLGIGIADESYLTFQAQLYHALGDTQQRDSCIERIESGLNEQIRLMDYFEDFYEYGELLLTINRYNSFLTLIKRLEELAVEAKVLNLQQRIRSLKLDYYKKCDDQNAYLQEAALFYEDSVKMECSNRAMVRGMMDICCTLDEERERRLLVEAENQELAKKSETDALTGLPNRLQLNRQSIQEFAFAAANHLPVAVEILDIDYFKQYNDNYGHQMGDRCICMIAEELKRIAGYEGVRAYRYGGDEFVVLYTNLEKDRVGQIAEELRSRILHRGMEHEYSLASNIVSISQGICWGYPNRSVKMADFLHTADNELYEVKKTTRDCIAMTSI